MIDKISIDRIQLLHPNIRGEVMNLVDIANSVLPQDLNIRIVQGLRTFEEQDALYAQGRTTPGPRVTNARGGKSYHNYGIAFDFVLIHDKNHDGRITSDELIWRTDTDLDNDRKADWMEVVNIFTTNGWEWGGNFKSIKDYPHLQKTFGYTIPSLLAKFISRDFIPGTRYVNL